MLFFWYLHYCIKIQMSTDITQDSKMIAQLQVTHPKEDYIPLNFE